jgi:D-alanyl-D-alanine carboxypeptidase/D-alanyl-D-alanine-endopeptidase (penicillin-binding protein 4)
VGASVCARITAVAATAVCITGLLSAGATAAAADGPPEAPAPAVLPPASPVAARPTPDGVSSAIGRLVRRSLGSASVVVIDPTDGTVLFDARGGRPRIPASTAKLATAAAALDVLGAETRLPTIAYREDATVVLVGGGDPTLRRTDLVRMAEQVAEDFGTQTAVTVRYDATAFTGPALGPGWAAGFAGSGVAAPVSALVVDGGRVRPGASARVADPARQAAQVFAAALEAEGLKVRRIRPGPPGAAAREVARTDSPPVGDIVQRMLTDSENDYAEALAHLVGGDLLGDASFAGGARATKEALAGLGIDVDGVTLADGSGLSRANRLPARFLADLLATSVTGAPPELAAIPAGLAVAGLTGTLADRFTSAATRDGRGFVHAKTGTLTGVSALAGTVLDRDGRTLVFAMVDDRARSLGRSRETMDVVASTLATCGCG